MSTIRTFIAFDTPIEIRESMKSLQSELKKSNADVRWEPSEKFHATIKFLGDVEERNLPRIIAKIEQSVSNVSSFIVSYREIGTFPDKHHPRVIWIGCENLDGNLLKMKNELDAALHPLGFPIEERTFHPHITLGRVKSANRIKDLLSMLENLTFEPRSTKVERIVVMKSMLKPQGSEYSLLTTIPLSLTS
jgi:2'-5' RNA ligase